MKDKNVYMNSIFSRGVEFHEITPIGKRRDTNKIASIAALTYRKVTAIVKISRRVSVPSLTTYD